MQVIYHLGVHCTCYDRIVKCLVGNARSLMAEGIIVPKPRRYRKVIAETMVTLRNQDITLEIQEGLVDTILKDNVAKRLILSHDTFLGVPGQALGNGIFYPLLTDKIERMTKLFGAYPVEFHIALSNPAVFIPDVFAKAKERNLNKYLEGSDPMTMHWSEMIARLREAAPTSKVFVWANEDTPLMWPQVLKTVSGHSDAINLTGLDAFYASLMSAAGLKRMTGYLESHPPQDTADMQRIVAAFLDKFAIEGAIETEIDLPGWSESYVDALSALYEQDLALIAGMDGVEFLSP